MTRIISTLLIICLLLTGCSGLSHSSTTATEQTIVAKTLFAMNQVKSFNLDTDITNTYKIIEGAQIDTTEWKGTKIVDVSNRETAMKMSITDVSKDIIANLNAALEMYFKDGKEYLQGPYGENPWAKTRFDNSLWKRETQIPYLAEILKTAIQSNLQDNEKINGVDCYVLTVTPSIQAAIDFVVSQEQPFGAQIDTIWGGAVPVVRADAYQSGSIKFWIAWNSYLPVKVEVNIDFRGNVGGGMITATPYTPTTNPVDSSFTGQIIFSNYNQPVSIQVPQEALDAK